MIRNPARKTVALLLAATLVAGLAACSAEQSRGGKVQGDTLTVFSSLPLQGPQAARGRAIVNGQKLALQDAGGKAGEFKVNFASSDDATAADGEAGWDPDRTAENARRSVENSRTIAYVGDLDSGASAISIPITNEAGIGQVSPASTAVGLTKLVPGADAGEPDKYYPSGGRTFARVIPGDDVEASAAAAWTRKLGAGTVFLLGDRNPEGDGRTDLFRAAAEEQGGPRVVGEERMDPRAEDYRDLAAEIAQERPDAVYFGGNADSNAARLWRDLHAALPDALLVGSGGLLEPSFYGRLGSSAASTYVTSPAQDPRQLPDRGRRFVRDYARAFGERPDPYAAYGYAAMAMVLDAIERAGDRGGERDRVVEEIFDTSNLAAPVGTFSIDDNGDTSLTAIAGYRIKEGRPVYTTALRGQPQG